jgi:uncharacterized protein YceK
MRMRSVTLAVLVTLLVLSGCTTQTTDYSAQTARPLQKQVLAVAESSAAGDPAASLTHLDELAASLEDARARGTISANRYASITASIALVRTDLEAAIAAQEKQPEKNKKDKPPSNKGSGQGD